MRLTNPTIRVKLIGYAIVSLAVLVAAIVVMLSGIPHITASISKAKRVDETLRTVGSVQKAVLEMESRLASYLAGRAGDDLEGYGIADRQARDGFKKLKEFLAEDDGLTKQLQQANVALTEWRNKVAAPALTKATNVKGTPSRQEGTSSVKSLGDASPAGVLKILVALTDNLLTPADNALTEIGDGVTRIEISAFLGMAVYAAFLLIASFVFARHIARPISAATDLAESIKRGGLSRSMKVKGLHETTELGTTLNEMASSLVDNNKRILEGVDVLTDSVSQIASTASELFAGASGTSSAVTETTSILNEMEKTAKVVNETARNIVGHAEQSDEIATSGTKATGDTLEKMHLISEKMEIVGASVAGLSDNTRFVEDIIGVVKDLADQSNLLAVNASIEAARAGEHGKGFAVVAHEIKSLADQSREATENVSKILQEIRKSVTAVVMATEEGGKAVERGVKQSEAAGESIEKLAGRIAEFSQSAGVISSSSGRQFARVERAAAAMRGVELAMKESVEGTTQLETEARRLGELAQSLKDLVRRYD